MCGIFGYIGQRQAVSIVLDGLRKLEYRGYDSSGIAWICGKKILTKKHLTRPSLLLLPKTDTSDVKLCIGHTRWATHGKVSIENTHPILDYTGQFAIVHNGIVEEHKKIKDFLEKIAGIKFQGETDTECLVNLISHNYNNDSDDIFISLEKTIESVQGNYAFILMYKNMPDILFAFRKGITPLYIGRGKNGEYFVSSDTLALSDHTSEVAILPNDKVCDIVEGRVYLTLDFKKLDIRSTNTTKNNYKHFMLKEIMEQPQCLTNVDFTYFPIASLRQDYSQISLIGCGTSYHAALIGAKLINQFVNLAHAHAEYASEYIDFNNGSSTNLLIALSQSGETADTIEAIKASEIDHKISIINIYPCSLSKFSDPIIINVGLEIGVASTKAFIGQLAALLRLCGITNQKLSNIAKSMRLIIDQSDKILSIVSKYVDRNNWLYLGRGYNYPIALEGALKLKEISYIHAEGMPAAEMKHGPIALIDDGMPCVFIAPQGKDYNRIISNIEEVRSRGGRIITIATEGDKNIKNISDDVIYIPNCEEHLQPLLTVVPLQLIAYHAGVLLGRDVDRPRNLAKSVTV